MSAVYASNEELFAYLDLPENERAGKSKEFLDKAARRILSYRERLAVHAEEVLPRYGLAGHGPDVANEVIIKASMFLKTQMIDRDRCALPWLRTMPLFCWLLVVHGRPFQENNSGVITNYIRKHAKLRYVSISALEENGFEVEDHRLDDPETVLVQKQRRALLDAYLKERHRQVEAALKEFDKSKPRDVLVYRLRTGTHRFSSLDPASVLTLARALPRADRKRIETIAELRAIGSGKTIDPETVGELTGIGKERVRQIVRKIAADIKAACSSTTNNALRQALAESHPWQD